MQTKKFKKTIYQERRLDGRAEAGISQKEKEISEVMMI
jgi:hypothetical protein